MYLHTRRTPIFHRDLKTEDILLSIVNNHLVAKLADFGLSSFAKSSSMSTVGTFNWWAPEIFLDDDI